MALIDRLAPCRRFHAADYVPFIIDARVLGRVRREMAEKLRAFPDVFRVDAAGVAIVDRLKSADARTEAVDTVLRALHERGDIPGWRGEHYRVSTGYYAAPLLTMERAAVPLFGVIGYGVHVNGIVEKADGLHLWVAKRSMAKPTAPGELDHIVAGGQPAGLSVRENLIKECAEEAGIDAPLAAQATAAGTVSYLTERPDGLRHDVLFCFDLRLPAAFTPAPVDGEVDAFYLWPMARVIETLRETDDFKYNVALVIIDFLIRNGHIAPDDPEYIVLSEGMRLGHAGPFAVC